MGSLLRHRPSAGRRTGAGELSSALPGPHVCAPQRLCASCLRARFVGRLAGLRPGCSASLRDGVHRAHLQGDHHPGALHRIVKRLGIHREIETVGGVGPTMLGHGLVALSMVVMLRVTPGADPLAREDLAFALSVVLLGLLMMVTRRNAVSQVVGFMSLETGSSGRDWRQGHAARRRDQRRLLHSHRLHRDRHLPVPHPRTLRHGRRPGARPLPWRTAMSARRRDRRPRHSASLGGVAAALPGYRRLPRSTGSRP